MGNGQGFGDLLIKSGAGMKVTWIIVLPKEMKLGFGVGSGSGAQELCPRVPTGAAKATEQKTWEQSTRQSLAGSVGSEAS